MTRRANDIWREVRFGFRAGWREGVGPEYRHDAVNIISILIGAVIAIYILA